LHQWPHAHDRRLAYLGSAQERRSTLDLGALLKRVLTMASALSAPLDGHTVPGELVLGVPRAPHHLHTRCLERLGHALLRLD
jgi:hypothetical protein